MTLRRRARRRLVGAIAIALAAVLLLPMLFDPEPRPLGPDVDIRIPAPSTPFEQSPTAEQAPPAGSDENEPPPLTAEPTLGSPAPTATANEPEATGVRVAGKPEASASADKIAGKTAENAAENAAEKAAEKAREKAKEKIDLKPEQPLPKPSGAFASQGFYLQLGAFTSESNARQLREKVEAAGFKVGLADSNGQYRVRVGPIPEKERALEMQSKLKAKGFTSVMLGP